VAFALERPDVAPGFREYLRGLDLDPDAPPPPAGAGAARPEPGRGAAPHPERNPPPGAGEGDPTVKNHEMDLEDAGGEAEAAVGIEQPQGERKMPAQIPLLPVRDVWSTPS